MFQLIFHTSWNNDLEKTYIYGGGNMHGGKKFYCLKIKKEKKKK